MPLGQNNRKILDLNSPGDATSMGGDDFDILTLWHENVDLTAGEYAGVPHKSTVATPTEYRDNKLRLLNPAQTKTLNFRTLAFTDNYDITVPLVDASDTLLLVDHTAQFYNKTFSTDDNSIIATGISSGDILKSNGTKFVLFPRGLPGQVLTVKDDGLDLAWEDPSAITPPPAPPGSPPPPPSGPIVPDDNTVTTAKIVDLAVTNAKIANLGITSGKIADSAITTAKILDANVTNAKLAGSITGSKLVSGTITGTQIASSTVTNTHLAGSISDDKLLPIADISKLPSSILFDWTTYKEGHYTLTTSNGGGGVFFSFLSAIGNYETIRATDSGIRARHKTGTSSGSQAGLRTTFPLTRRNNNPRLLCRYSIPNDNVDKSLFIGFISATGSFPSLGLTTGLNAVECFGLWHDSANTNLQVVKNDGVGNAVGTNLSPTTTTASLGTHTIEITTNDTAGSWTLNFDGVNNTHTTDIPTTGTDLSMFAYIQNKTGSGGTERLLDIRYLQWFGAAA